MRLILISTGTLHAFLKDIGARSDGYTLYRIDNDRGYCKENCVWATRKEQMRNRRGVKISEEIAAEIRRRDYIIPTDLARIYGVSLSAIREIQRDSSWA